MPISSAKRCGRGANARDAVRSRPEPSLIGVVRSKASESTGIVFGYCRQTRPGVKCDRKTHLSVASLCASRRRREYLEWRRNP